MMAEQLTLESLGVDLAELARRITDAQTAAGRDDDTCARLAGVTVDRWRAWKEGRERPGVARVPKIAEAVASSPPALMFGVGGGLASGATLDYARSCAAFVLRAATIVEQLTQLAAEITAANAHVVDGHVMAAQITQAAAVLEKAS